MGLIFITNLFFSPYSLEKSDVYYEELQFSHVEKVVDHNVSPLMGDETFIFLTQSSFSKKEVEQLIKIYKELHSTVTLAVNLNPSAQNKRLLSDLTIADVKFEFVNCKNLNLEYYRAYVNSLGLYDETIIKRLHVNLKGKHDMSPLIIARYLQDNDGSTAELGIKTRNSKYDIGILKVFLNQPTKKAHKQNFGRLLLREHHNYIKAIITNQLKMFIEMKQYERSIIGGNFDPRDKKISPHFYNQYKENLSNFHLSVLQDISKCLKSCRSGADIILLKHRIQKGGVDYNANDETPFW